MINALKLIFVRKYILKMKMSQELKKNTNFMGVTINPKGPENLMVLKALSHPSSIPLDIVKFVEVTDFKLNMIMFDYFWQVMVGNTGVHVATGVFEWFGYEGEPKEQKRKFITMLKNNAIEYKELTQKDKEIELDTSIQ